VTLVFPIPTSIFLEKEVARDLLEDNATVYSTPPGSIVMSPVFSRIEGINPLFIIEFCCFHLFKMIGTLTNETGVSIVEIVECTYSTYNTQHIMSTIRTYH